MIKIINISVSQLPVDHRSRRIAENQNPLTKRHEASWIKPLTYVPYRSV